MNLNTVDLRERVALCEDFTPAERALILAALGTVPNIMHSPTNYLGRIDHLWAVLSLDEGGEGLCAAPMGVGGMTLPLIAADKTRLDVIRPIARKIATAFRKPVRIAKFTTREDLEIFQP